MALRHFAFLCLFAAAASADVARIVPMHGVPVARAELERGLEIRRKYQETEP